jgi:hypothetical protein
MLLQQFIVDSMATVSMPQASSAWRPGVKVRKTHTGSGSRSGGTATTISSAPMSMPAALGWIVGKPSRWSYLGERFGRDMGYLTLLRCCSGGDQPPHHKSYSMVIGVNPRQRRRLPPVRESRMRGNQDPAWARRSQWACWSELLVATPRYAMVERQQEGFSGEESRLAVMVGSSRRRFAASKIAAILKAGIRSTAFSTYLCGVADAQAVRRLLSTCLAHLSNH